jgi:hypothetical protein
MTNPDDGRHMSLPAYRQLIESLLAQRYSVVSFKESRADRRDLIVRHDIDMCLDRAVRMATLEAEMGVRGNYFVLLNTEMYNVGSSAGQSALRKIAQLGHALGLHFDPSDIDEGDVPKLQKAVRCECERLEDYLATPVEVVTFHRPAKWLLGFSEPLAGRLHGYQPRFFTDMGYCSDSEGRFRFHHPLDHPAVVEGRALQLVTHPIWWCAGLGEGPIEKLERFLKERAGQLSDELAANCRPYATARVR